MKQPMRNKVIVLVVGSLLATTGWTGERHRAPKEESIGLGSGAAIGALAGGPVGLIIGAAFGGWLGDRFHHEKSERIASEQRYDEARTQATTLEHELGTTKYQAAAIGAQLETERVAHRRELQQAFTIEVFFRTEDSVVGGEVEERLAKLAELIAPMDGTLIRLEGHTDVRGTEDFNAQLSAERAVAVRDALIRAGMPAERIVLNAAGEGSSTAIEQDADGMALDRRVEMSVVDLTDTSRVARETQD
jgi:outer membrane protein OmpA-like peptidoglycan-associated protein